LQILDNAVIKLGHKSGGDAKVTKTVSLKSLLAVAGLAGALLCAASTAQAQDAVPHTPQIKFDPAASHPPIPAGLQLVCTPTPDTGAASNTCPVIHYGAYTTWIYSFADNRVAFAIVTYDGNGNVLQNLTRPGARYVFDALSDDKGQKITLVGQARNFAVINWSDLPH
jgi:hypothetical protein